MAENGQGMPPAVAEALKRLARLKLPRTLYERAKRAIEGQGQPAIERWLSSYDAWPGRGPPARPQKKAPRANRLTSNDVAQTTPRGQVIRLPAWPDEARAMPNEVCRSAIFTVRHRGKKRDPLVNQAIFMLGDGVITYTGIELRAEDDELVWQQILNRAKRGPLGQWIEFT